MNYKGKNVLITNATSTLGKTLTYQLAQIGANIIALSSEPIQLERLRGALLEEYTPIHPYLWNENNPRHLQSILRTIVSKHGSLHFVVNNSVRLKKPGFHDVLVSAANNVIDVSGQAQKKSGITTLLKTNQYPISVRKFLKSLDQSKTYPPRSMPLLSRLAVKHQTTSR